MGQGLPGDHSQAPLALGWPSCLGCMQPASQQQSLLGASGAGVLCSFLLSLSTIAARRQEETQALGVYMSHLTVRMSAWLSLRTRALPSRHSCGASCTAQQREHERQRSGRGSFREQLCMDCPTRCHFMKRRKNCLKNTFNLYFFAL